MQPADPDIQVIGVERRFTLWAGYYCIAVVSAWVFLIGDLGFAVMLIVIAEMVAFFWRPTPTLGASSYSGPTPAAWQAPVRAFRWYEIVIGFHAAVGLVVVASLALVMFLFALIALIVFQHYSIRPASVTVAVLLAGWLVTRHLWVPTLRKSLGQSTRGLRSDLSPSAPAIYVSADGYDVDFKTLIVGLVGKRNRLVHIGFAELDDVRMLVLIQ